jgi:hypothetical protein
MIKHILQEFISIAENKGGECTSRKYINNKTKLAFKCSQGHEWEAIPSNILRGHWCKICGNINQGKKKALSIEVMKSIAIDRGGLCLSDDYTNTFSKLKWQCSKGHIWYAVGGSVKSGTWCPICAGKDQDENFRLITAIAKEKGGECLSESYITAKTKLKFRCNLGHEWLATADSVKRGSWCQSCINLSKGSEEFGISIDFLNEIAKIKGGKLLSDIYINSGEKLKWQCANGHIFETKYDHIKTGSWCPICSSGLIESIVRLFFEYITGQTFLKVRPKWLVNDLGKRLELDGYNKELGIAFEYHGEQHFNYNPFFHRNKNTLKKRLEDDAVKRELCSKNNVFLIEIDYKVDKDDIFQFILEALNSHPQSSERIINSKEISISELNTWKRDDLLKLYKIAQARDGKCLSTYYLGTSVKLKWQCSEGHTWQAIPSSIKRGSWCPVCAGKDQDENFKLITAIAKEKGGECLSESYVSAKTKLRFRCSLGHEWLAIADSVKRGKWCPKCHYTIVGHKNSKYSLSHFQKIAQEKGGICKSENYKNTDSRLTFKCSEGHEWETTAWVILKGHWCKRCSSKKKVIICNSK